jgi:hypothetical protein
MALFKETPRSLRIYFIFGGLLNLFGGLASLSQLQSIAALDQLLETTTGSSPAPAIGIEVYVSIIISLFIGIFLIYLGFNIKKYLQDHSTFLIVFLLAGLTLNGFTTFTRGGSLVMFSIFALMVVYLILNIRRISKEQTGQISTENFLIKKVTLVLGILILLFLGVNAFNTYQEKMTSFKKSTEEKELAVDIKALEKIGGEYAKDDKYVYRVVEEDDFIRIVEGADPDTYQYLGSYYGKDKKNVYVYQEVLEGADPKTFQYLWEDFGKDSEHAYFFYSVISGVDFASFEHIGMWYTKDKNNIYYEARVMEGVDMDSFEHLGDFYAKDKNSIYALREVMETADYQTFEYIGGLYAKDKNFVYTRSIPLEGADPETFVFVGEFRNFYYGKDKNNVYRDSRIKSGVDPQECTKENLRGCAF